MHNVIGTRISSSKFTWVPKSKEFVAEASDLHGINLFSQVYNDACDEGFVLVSQKTGKEVPFTLARIQHDADRDIAFWKFTAATRDPKLAGVSVIIFND